MPKTKRDDTQDEAADLPDFKDQVRPNPTAPSPHSHPDQLAEATIDNRHLPDFKDQTLFLVQHSRGRFQLRRVP